VAAATVPQLGIEDVHRFTLDDYHRLIESGGFDEDSLVHTKPQADGYVNG
jgi:hypothetical protein